MAVRHARMLFRYPPNATACLFECSDACNIYNLCGPTLYAPPPPPPPPQQNPTSPIRLHHSSRLSLALVASASSLAAASLILLLSCLLSIHLRRRRRRRSASSAAAGGGGAGVADAGGFVDEDGEVDHHVWYIRTVGLDEPTIGAIAVWVYQSGEGGALVGGGGGGGGGCAVCLAEFRDGELLRLLPKCGHAFHVACIDAWLRGHVNCPLCRAPIMAPTPAPGPAPGPAPADALPSLSPSLSPSSSSSSSSSDSTISDHDGSDSSNQAEVRGIEEETDAGDVEIGGDNAIEVNSTVELSSSSSRVISNSQSQEKV